MKWNFTTRRGLKHGAFTLIELLAVIAIIGILAALIVGLAGKASMTKIIKRAEVENQALVMAIEVYKSKLGYYPQDGYNAQGQPPPNSPLYNELTKNRIPDAYTIQDQTKGLGVKDIANTGVNSDNFYKDIKNAQFEILGSGPRADDKTGSTFDAGRMIYAYKKTPWRYNSSSPTNNPDSFDLWVEIDIAGKKEIIGNWKK